MTDQAKQESGDLTKFCSQTRFRSTAHGSPLAASRLFSADHTAGAEAGELQKQKKPYSGPAITRIALSHRSTYFPVDKTGRG
jgi:hypothetical protein